MSLILDALRKADAERERGSVPGLHSQPVVPHSAQAPRKPASRPHWLFVAAGVAAGLALAATWVMVGREAPGPVAAVDRVPPVPPGPSTTAAGAPAPAASPAPMSGGVAPPPAAAPVDGQPAAQPAPWPAPEGRKATRDDSKADPQPATAGSTPTDATVHSREQLPPDIRAALPPFTIGGSIYSPNPAGRSLIVNGQLYRERDRLTQDLSLEEIKLKAAIFSFRGYRFEVLF